MMCKIWGFLFVFLLIEEEAERVTIQYIFYLQQQQTWKVLFFVFGGVHRQQYRMMMCVPSRPFPTHLAGHRPLPPIFFLSFFSHRIWPNSSWETKSRMCTPLRLGLSSKNNQFLIVKKKMYIFINDKSFSFSSVLLLDYSGLARSKVRRSAWFSEI